MARITQKKEVEQYDKHKYTYKKTNEDKVYQTFLNSIYDEDGKLNVVGKDDIINVEHPEMRKITPIPEEVAIVCRVYDPFEDKEFLVYDVYQWGYYEDGTRTPRIYLQDIGMYREFTWEQKPIPQEVSKGDPVKKKFKDYPTGQTARYEIHFNGENLRRIRAKSNNRTALYVYDLSKSGKGGKDGKIGVPNWKDFEERPFQELMEGSYLLQSRLQAQMKMLEQKEQYLNLREQTMGYNNNNTESTTTTSLSIPAGDIPPPPPPPPPPATSNNNNKNTNNKQQK